MRRASFVILLMMASRLPACDSVQPDEADRLVVESFFETDAVAPAIHVRRTVPTSVGADVAKSAFITGAKVTVTVNAEPVSYIEAPGTSGLHVPDVDAYLKEGDLFTVDVSWRGQRGRAVGSMPAKVKIDSIMLDVPAAPVEAVLLDSLKLDSLGVDAKTGYLYPIEATLWWEAKAPRDEDWMQAQLKPFSGFSSAVVDFFLLPEQVFAEHGVPAVNDMRSWTGLYAVAVADAGDPLPEHSVRLSLVRGSRDYADYVFTRTAPERREPASNVGGALGIVAGISVDSLVVQLNGTHAGKRTVVSSRK